MNDDLAREFLLGAFPNPERKGCPDENTLKGLSEGRLPPDHPARAHLGSCSECFAEFQHYQQDAREGRSTPRHDVGRVSFEDLGTASGQAVSQLRRISGRYKPWVLAASVVVVLGGGFVAFRHEHKVFPPDLNLAAAQPVNASVDLFSSGTLRGASDGTTPLRQVYLPAAVVQLDVTLPRFSEPGQYSVLVSKDKTGNAIVGRASGDTTEQNGKVIVRVPLDLRSASPGAYFLSTVRGADNGTYYYPLQIR